MMKFKSLFRKHGNSSSNNDPTSTRGTGWRSNGARLKINRFETAVSSPATTGQPSLNTVANGSHDRDRHSTLDKSDVKFGKNNNLTDNGFKVTNENNMDLDTVLRQLETTVKEKLCLESSLHEFTTTHGQIETLKKELKSLKEQKEELQKSLMLKLGTINTPASIIENQNGMLNRFGRLPNSAPASIAPPSTGSTEMLDTPDWDKRSSSSLSEVSVACLQDRIMQMEETHYSTSEELQATLQELADLQTQLTELQSDNERLGEEKGVLLESLCRQTEKLEDARTKVDTLQGLLLDSSKLENSSGTEREQKLLELLRDAQVDKEDLLAKQKELSNELQEYTKRFESANGEQTELKQKIDTLETLLKNANLEYSNLETEMTALKEQNSSKTIEIERLTTLLENARSTIEEMNATSEKQGDKSELEELVNNLRKEKDSLETKLASLQEQLSRSTCEVSKLREQTAHLQEELDNSSASAKSALISLESKWEKSRENAAKLSGDLQSMQENCAELQRQVQCYLDDKRQLKAVLLETQKRLSDFDKENAELKQNLENERKLHEKECAEWSQFQSDLLMTVRVANDIKTEAQLELERLVLENKQLRDKNNLLESQIEKLKELEKPHSPVALHRSVSSDAGVSLFSSMMNQELTRRGNLKTLSRQDSRLSVKSLIESIENATKQAKSCSTGSGLAGSRCSSTTSLNSLSNFVPGSVTSYLDSEVKTTSTGSSDKNDDGQTDFSGQRAVCRSSTDNVSSSSSILTAATRNIDYASRCSNGDLSERKDPLQALVQKGGSKRNALLKWCQNKTLGYSNIDITNFSSSWNDGLALCALLHSYLPDKIPYDALNPVDKKRNFTVAFEAAESVGIKTTLNLNEMIQQERPDWNQVMAYVTSIFRHFES